MTVIKYKDFQGSVSYEDNTLIIQILHIDDFITAECDSANNVAAVFRDLVDDYIETCAAVGRKPCKPFKGSLNIRISPDLHRRAAMTAAAKEVTLNAWIGEVLENAIENDHKIAQYAADLAYSRILSLEIQRHSDAYQVDTDRGPFDRLVSGRIGNSTNRQAFDQQQAIMVPKLNDQRGM